MTLLLWILVALAGVAVASQPIPNAYTFLKNDAGLTAKTLEKLDSKVIVEQLSVNDKTREIAVIGAVRITVPRQFFVAHYRNIENFMRTTELKQIGTFSQPPNPADMASFRLPESDIEVMQACQINDCKIKLPSKSIEGLQRINWSAPDVTHVLTKRFCQEAKRYVRDYLVKGNIGLLIYSDKKEKQALTEGFNHLLSQSPYIYTYMPQLYQYLKQFPHSAPKGVENFFYWTVEDFGYRPVTAITHATLSVQPEPTATMIAQKQIYASHYFLARLTLMILVDDPKSASTPAIHVIYLDRSLFDDKLGWANQHLLARGVRKDVNSRLERLRERLETQYRSSTPSKTASREGIR